MVADAVERGGVPQVGLAHLDEPAAGGEQAERSVGEGTGQRVQHDVDALGELPCELEVTRRREVRDAESADGVLLRRARRGEHLGAGPAGELDGGHPDATGGRVDEHGLPGGQPAEVEQAVVGGDERDRHGRGLGEGPPGGHRDEQAGIGHRGRAESTGEQAEHAITDGEPGDVRRDFGDDTGGLGPEDSGRIGVHAERDEDIAEVDPGRAHGDPDVPVREGLRRCRSEGEAVEGAAGGGQPPGLPRDDQGTTVGAREARRGESAVTDGELGFGGGQGGEIGPRRVVEVEELEPAGVLGLRGAHQAPRGGRGGIGTGAPGDDDEAAGPIGGEPRLDEGEGAVGRLADCRCRE